MKRMNWLALLAAALDLASSRRKLLVCLAFILVLSGCAISPIPAEKLSRARAIGAISLFGDELHIAQLGTTVFNNVDKDEKAGWAIDRFTTEKVKNSLAGKPLLRFVDIDYNYSDFEPIYRSRTRFPAANYDLKYAREALSKLREDYAIDLLILVARIDHQVGNSPLYVHGCAVYSRSFLGLKIETKAFLAAEIAVVDMADFTILTDAAMIHSRNFESSFWKENVTDYFSEELRLLEVFYKGALESKLDDALAGFGLIPTAPKP